MIETFIFLQKIIDSFFLRHRQNNRLRWTGNQIDKHSQVCRKSYCCFSESRVPRYTTNYVQLEEIRIKNQQENRRVL